MRHRLPSVGWACASQTSAAAGQASGQDFNERYAAWQGGATAPPMPAASTPPPEVGGTAEGVPAPGPAGSRRILGEVYTAPLHTPNYNQPWTNSPCATCSHNPGFVPASIPLAPANSVAAAPAWAMASISAVVVGPAAAGPAAAVPADVALAVAKVEVVIGATCAPIQLSGPNSTCYCGGGKAAICRRW